MPSAYQRRTYDNSQHTGRMGDLLRARSETDARAIEQAGQNSARMWSELGGITASTMGQLANYADQAPERQRNAAQAARIEAQTEDDKIARATKKHIDEVLKQSIDPDTGRLDYGKAAEAIGQVAPEQAEAFWAKADAQSVEAAKRDAERAREVAKRLATVVMASDEDEAAGPGALQSAPRLYASVREEAIASSLIKPEELPEAYDPSVVKQEVLQAMTADQVFQKLWAAKPANAEYTLGPGQKRFGADGRVVASVPAAPSATAEAPYTLSPGQKRFGSDGRVVASVPERPPSSGGGGAGNANTARDDLRAAEQWKQRALGDVETRFTNGEIDQAQLERAKAEIQKSYLVQLGQPDAGPVRPPDARDAKMGDLVRPPMPPPSAPAAPFGATPAAAAQPKMVRMRAPNGEIGLVPESQVQAALKAGAVVVK